MRVTSSLFVAALIRRASIAGAQALVARHGADEAGAIFLTLDRLDGLVDLYGPAPQSAFSEEGPADRLFTLLRQKRLEIEIAELLAKEIRFDPDLWVVAIEDRQGRAFIELAKA